MTDVLTEDEIRILMKLNAAIDILRSYDHKIPASYISAALNVAINPGNGPTHYAKAMGTIQPIASRLLLEIGEKARHRDGPLGLVEAQISPESLRDKQYHLTAKGLDLAKRLADVLR